MKLFILCFSLLLIPVFAQTETLDEQAGCEKLKNQMIAATVFLVKEKEEMEQAVAEFEQAQDEYTEINTQYSNMCK